MYSIQLRMDYIFQFSPNTGWRKDLNLVLENWISAKNDELIELITKFLNKIKNKEFGNEPTQFLYDELTEWAENSLIWLKQVEERNKTGEPNINGLEELMNAKKLAGEAFRRLEDLYNPEVKYVNNTQTFHVLMPNEGWREKVNTIRMLYKTSQENRIDYQFLLTKVHSLMLDLKHNRIGKLSNWERFNLQKWGENWMRVWTFLQNKDYRTTHPDINMLDIWQDEANNAFMNLLKLNPSKQESFNDR